MGKHDRCVIGVCNNDKRYPQHMVTHSNVKGEIKMHSLPKDETIKAAWIHQILKGRKDLKSAQDIPKNCHVCSIHFIDGKPTKGNPTPTLFLTVSTNTLPTPVARKAPRKRSAETKSQPKEIKSN